MGRPIGVRAHAAHVRGARPVTAVTAVISVIMGIAIGWCISSVITSATVSHSQERMQRKVRYWLAETARARATADELARELAARQGSLPGHDDWPRTP
jgi:hypothetical protein